MKSMPQTQPQITDNLVEIINYTSPESDTKQTKKDLINRENCEVKNIPQAELASKYENWNWIKHSPEDLELYAKYLANSQSLEIYYNHEKAQKEFGDRFWFDGSLNIPTKDISKEKIENSYQILKIPSKGFKPESYGYYDKNLPIKIAEGSQGMSLMKSNYKIMWNYIKPDKFYFTDNINVLPRFQQFCIASNNKTELLYLFAIFNSKITETIFNYNFKIGHEKDVLFGLTVIKNFIRVPILNTPQKLEQKQKLIQLAQELLDAETVALQDLVDFDDDRVLPQKWDWWAVHHGQVFLTVDNHDYWFEIKNKLNENRIYDALEAKYGDPVKKIEEGINFNEFKKTTIFDKNHQTKVKNQIDELVLGMYQI